MLKVLVTGASGLLGNEVVTALAAVGEEVVGISREAVGTGPEAGITAIDLRDPKAVPALVRHDPGMIVHAAAVLPREFFGEDAVAAAHANRAIDDVVLSAARATGCHVIYLSGTSLYGCVNSRCDETAAVRPRGPYLGEKLRSEEQVLSMSHHATVLRISSPYGVRQRSQTVLQRFVRQAVRNEDLLYYGSGSREQDFIAVEDIAAAVVASVQQRARGLFNIASGHPVSMRALAELVISVVGSRGSRARPGAAADPEEDCRAFIDVGRAERELHWRAGTSLEAGLRRLTLALIRSSDQGHPHPSLQ